jgi:carboxypeptidase C (cathepsin A)
MSGISNQTSLVRIPKVLFGLRDNGEYVCKIWVMIPTQSISPSKFIALVCFFSVLSVTAPSMLAQQGRRGGGPPPQAAQAAAPVTPEAKPAAASPESKTAATPGMAMAEPPLPPDAHAEQSIQMDGKTLHYTATVGTLAVRDSKGALSGEVVYTAYTVEGKDRPVTFAFNGGPGAASVYLNLGAIGPKKAAFGAEGQSPSDPATLTDNPGTWLDFTDIVFIDPIGTGFSRSLVSPDEAKKQFYGPDQDIAYLSKCVYDWLVKNGRLQSRKYLVGESYGGYRGPRLTAYLQSEIGVAMNGLVLVSPALAPQSGSPDISPIPWMLTLPSIVAANYERQGKLTNENMATVIDYTRGEYAEDLLKGNSDPAATPRLVKKVTELTGLDPTFVKQSGGRLETQAFLREEFRETGKLGSRYDPNVTAYDPFPYNPTQETQDPILLSIIAPTTTAMVDFVTRTVGWKTDARYNALSNEVARAWDRTSRNGAFAGSASATDLRVAVATDPKLRVVIAHGWADLSCPFMGSVLTVSQIPIMGDPTRVQVHEYPGGHMYYARTASSLALRKDVMEMVNKH